MLRNVKSSYNKKRQSNFELLRILLMIMIVSSHLVWQSGAIEFQVGKIVYFSYFIGSSARIAVNTFLMLGCYFLVDSDFNSRRILSIWLQEFFYTVGITLIVFFTHPGSVSITELKWACFPIFNFWRNHWYISVYLVFLFVSPFLKRVLQGSKTYLRKFCTVLILSVSLWCTFHYGQEDVFLDCLCWFTLIYVFIGYAKKYIMNQLHGKWRYLFLSGGGYLLLLVVAHADLYMQNSTLYGKLLLKLVPWAAQYLGDYKSLPNFVIAFSLLVFFEKLRIKPNKIINFFGSSTLAVYIVHQTNALIPIIWNDIFNANKYMSSYSWVLYIPVMEMVLFICVTIFDKFRICILEKPLLNSKPCRFICNCMDKFYSDVDYVTIKNRGGTEEAIK